MDIFTITNNDGEYFYKVVDNDHLYKEVAMELKKSKRKRLISEIIAVVTSWTINFILLYFKEIKYLMPVIFLFMGVGTYFISINIIKLIRKDYY